MSGREDENDGSHHSSGGTALTFSLPAHERAIAREVVWKCGEMESDARRLLSSAERKHVTHWSESRENSHLPVLCHAQTQI